MAQLSNGLAGILHVLHTALAHSSALPGAVLKPADPLRCILSSTPDKSSFTVPLQQAMAGHTTTVLQPTVHVQRRTRGGHSLLGRLTSTGHRNWVLTRDLAGEAAAASSPEARHLPPKGRL